MNTAEFSLRPVRAGFVGFGEINTPKEIIRSRCADAAALLKNAGFDLVMTDPVCDDPDGREPLRAKNELSGHDFDLLIICIAGWAPPAPRLPSLEIKLDGKPEDFFQQVMSQHYIICYGDYAAKLRTLCGILGVVEAGQGWRKRFIGCFTFEFMIIVRFLLVRSARVHSALR